MVGRHHAVLVVDDEPVMRDLWSEMLAELGHDVTSAANGVDAMRLLHDGLVPCLVLSDVRMPGMDGWELARAVAQDAQLSALTVVLVTGDRILSLTSPAGDKPRDSGELGALVERSCRQHRRPYNPDHHEG